MHDPNTPDEKTREMHKLLISILRIEKDAIRRKRSSDETIDDIYRMILNTVSLSQKRKSGD